MNISELVKRSHDTAVEKGFIKTTEDVGTTLMLIVSELGEALEADRNSLHSDSSINLVEGLEDHDTFLSAFKSHIKDTFEDEIADCFIRLGDLCAVHEIDIERHIEAKMRYNDTRPYKHGKKY